MNPITRSVVAVIRFYQVAISPSFAPKCRFTPTCSSYAVEAIGRFGLGRGTWLSVRRLSRCHPWHRGGHDPVPLAVDRKRCGDTQRGDVTKRFDRTARRVETSGVRAGRLRSSSC